MDYEYYDQYINRKTIGRRDITPLFEQPKIFSELLFDLSEPFKNISYDKVAGLDAMGFIIGGALAQREHKGFVCIRKGGKLPGVSGTVLKSSSFKDYTNTSKEFEINKSSISQGDKILLVDEWVQTGSQMFAAINLIEKLGGIVVGITVLGSYVNEHTKKLFDDYGLKAIELVK